MEILDFEKQQQLFIDHLEDQQKSFNTRKNYRTDLNIFKAFLQNKGRNLLINEITTTELQEYNEYLQQKYTSPNSVRRRVQALRLFFDFLILTGIYQDNPVKKVLVHPKVVDIPRPTKFVTIRSLRFELLTRVRNCDGHEKLLHCRNVLLLDLIYGGGLKVSDLERLNLSSISLRDNQYRVMIRPEKRDPYTVSLDAGFGENFEQYLELVEQGKNRSGLDFNNLLFNANPFKILSGGLSPRGIEVIFKEFSHQLNTAITAKSLRQACIFKWLNANLAQSRIKEWMGVQPQYSLKPYTDLLKSAPEDFLYLHI